MTIYIFLLISIFLFDHFRKSLGLSKRNYCIIIGTLFALVVGLRSVNVGSDTTVYYLAYKHMSVFPTFTKFFKSASGDYGYNLFVWYMHHFKMPFWVVTMVIATLFYFSVSRLIYKHSEMPALSYLMLMSFNFFQFSMTGMRQTCAMAFVMLALSEALKARSSLIKVLLFIFLAYLFHTSAAISLLILPLFLWKRKLGKYFAWISIILLLIGLQYRESLMGIMMFLSEESRFNTYGVENSGSGLSTYIVLFAIYVGMIVFRRRYVGYSYRYNIDYGLMFFAVLFQGLVMVQSVMFRIAWYFTIFLIIILPHLLKRLSSEARVIAIPIVYTCLLYMYLFITIDSANVVPYQFFWENVQ